MMPGVQNCPWLSVKLSRRGMETSIKRTFLEKGFIINAVAASRRDFGYAARRAQDFGAAFFASIRVRCFSVVILGVNYG